MPEGGTASARDLTAAWRAEGNCQNGPRLDVPEGRSASAQNEPQLGVPVGGTASGPTWTAVRRAGGPHGRRGVPVAVHGGVGDAEEVPQVPHRRRVGAAEARARAVEHAAPRVALAHH
eukprot:400988-Prymnesium_polylepis.1